MKRWNDLAMRNWTFDGKLELRPRRFIRFSSKPKDENVLVNCCRSQLNLGHLRRICSLSSMAKHPKRQQESSGSSSSFWR